MSDYYDEDSHDDDDDFTEYSRRSSAYSSSVEYASPARSERGMTTNTSSSGMTPPLGRTSTSVSSSSYSSSQKSYYQSGESSSYSVYEEEVVEEEEEEEDYDDEEYSEEHEEDEYRSSHPSPTESIGKRTTSTITHSMMDVEDRRRDIPVVPNPPDRTNTYTSSSASGIPASTTTNESYFSTTTDSGAEETSYYTTSTRRTDDDDEGGTSSWGTPPPSASASRSTRSSSYSSHTTTTTSRSHQQHGSSQDDDEEQGPARSTTSSSRSSSMSRHHKNHPPNDEDDHSSKYRHSQSSMTSSQNNEESRSSSYYGDDDDQLLEEEEEEERTTDRSWKTSSSPPESIPSQSNKPQSWYTDDTLVHTEYVPPSSDGSVTTRTTTSAADNREQSTSRFNKNNTSSPSSSRRSRKDYNDDSRRRRERQHHEEEVGSGSQRGSRSKRSLHDSGRRSSLSRRSQRESMGYNNDHRSPPHHSQEQGHTMENSRMTTNTTTNYRNDQEDSREATTRSSSSRNTGTSRSNSSSGGGSSSKSSGRRHNQSFSQVDQRSMGRTNNPRPSQEQGHSDLANSPTTTTTTTTRNDTQSKERTSSSRISSSNNSDRGGSSSRSHSSEQESYSERSNSTRTSRRSYSDSRSMKSSDRQLQPTATKKNQSTMEQEEQRSDSLVANHPTITTTTTTTTSYRNDDQEDHSQRTSSSRTRKSRSSRSNSTRHSQSSAKVGDNHDDHDTGTGSGRSRVSSYTTTSSMSQQSQRRGKEEEGRRRNNMGVDDDFVDVSQENSNSRASRSITWMASHKEEEQPHHDDEGDRPIGRSGRHESKRFSENDEDDDDMEYLVESLSTDVDDEEGVGGPFLLDGSHSVYSNSQSAFSRSSRTSSERLSFSSYTQDSRRSNRSTSSWRSESRSSRRGDKRGREQRRQEPQGTAVRMASPSHHGSPSRQAVPPEEHDGLTIATRSPLLSESMVEDSVWVDSYEEEDEEEELVVAPKSSSSKYESVVISDETYQIEEKEDDEEELIVAPKSSSSKYESGGFSDETYQTDEKEDDEEEAIVAPKSSSSKYESVDFSDETYQTEEKDDDELIVAPKSSSSKYESVVISEQTYESAEEEESNDGSYSRSEDGDAFEEEDHHSDSQSPPDDDDDRSSNDDSLPSLDDGTISRTSDSISLSMKHEEEEAVSAASESVMNEKETEVFESRTRLHQSPQEGSSTERKTVDRVPPSTDYKSPGSRNERRQEEKDHDREKKNKTKGVTSPDGRQSRKSDHGALAVEEPKLAAGHVTPLSGRTGEDRDQTPPPRRKAESHGSGQPQIRFEPVIKTQLCKSLAILGTMSDAGKSIMTAGICRLLANKGVRVAPFKGQNMSNNAAPALLPDKHRKRRLYRAFQAAIGGEFPPHSDKNKPETGYGEIGTAQSLQAEACRLVPRVEMNPVLLKSGGQNDKGEYLCSVFVLGQQVVRETYGDLGKRTTDLLTMVLESHEALAEATDCEVILMEGAGSCTELNLMDRDIVNLPLVRALGCPWLLVANIDCGGVFAQIVGTRMCLSKRDWSLCVGIIVNKLRGEAKYFEPGPKMIEEMVGKPVFVVPFLHDLHLPEEDGVGVERRLGWELASSHHPDENKDELDNKPLVVIVAYPHIAISDDICPLEADPRFRVQWRRRRLPRPYPHTTSIILPGSRLTRQDLKWLHDSGWSALLRKHVAAGGCILGICGGYQMLGLSVDDSHGVEGQPGSSQGLGLLPINTKIALPKLKVVHPRSGRLYPNGPGVNGFELHCGHSQIVSGVSDALQDQVHPLLVLDVGKPEGMCVNRVRGTYLHGILWSPEARVACLIPDENQLPKLKDYEVQDPLDRLAEHLESCGLDFKTLRAMISSHRHRDASQSTLTESS